MRLIVLAVMFQFMLVTAALAAGGDINQLPKPAWANRPQPHNPVEEAAIRMGDAPGASHCAHYSSLAYHIMTERMNGHSQEIQRRDHMGDPDAPGLVVKAYAAPAPHNDKDVVDWVIEQNKACLSVTYGTRK